MDARPLILGFTIPSSMMDELIGRDPTPAIQTHKFAWSVARALVSAFGKVKLLSVAPIQNYPTSKDIFFFGKSIGNGEISGVTLFFINLILIKHITRFASCLLVGIPKIREWGSNLIFIHGSHTPFLLFGAIMHKFGYKIVPILSDPPAVILSTDGLPVRWLKRLDQRLARMLVSQSSGVIALAPSLAKPFAADLPTLVFPGIVNGDWLSAMADSRNNRRPTVPRRILYAGTISRSYGSAELLKAAQYLSHYEIHFYGKGSFSEDISNSLMENVFYGGFVDAENLVDRIFSSDILINTRKSDDSISINSFPSKIIEYMSSGIPVLTTRISSIPYDISSYLNYIDDESALGIANAVGILKDNYEEALDRADKGRKAVLELYSEHAIGGKIQAFLEEVFAE